MAASTLEKLMAKRQTNATGKKGSEVTATEANFTAKLEMVRTGFTERLKAEAQRVQTVLDSEYWICLCFQSREQREAFLEQTRLGDADDKYLDGRAVAKKFGVRLPADPPTYSTKKQNRRLSELTED